MSGATTLLASDIGGGSGGGYTGVLATMAWSNASGWNQVSTNTQTISGISGTVSISASQAGAGQLSKTINGTSTGYTGAFNCHNGDKLSWAVTNNSGSATQSGTVTVTNATKSTTISSFSYVVRYT